jgi:porin
MKPLLLSGLVLLVTVCGVHAQFTERAKPSRFHEYYDPYPSNYIGSKQWWEGETALGDWWGMRNMLDDEGIEIFANYTTNIAGNPVGGKSQSVTYTDNTLFGVNLDFEKLIGWKGLKLTISGLNRSGSSLSEQNIGNQFTVQQIFGGQTTMFYALAFEQKLFDDKVSLKFGRFATGDDFGSSPIYWLYMNNGIDGNPQALPVNTQFSAYPWAVWGTRLKIEPTPEFYAMFGAYQVSDRIFNRAYHGLDWSIRGNDGIQLISQFGWTPELFKRPVSSAATTEMKGYPGHYWFGAYWSPWDFPQFGTDATASNSYGFYWHADQMIFQEVPGSDQGLTLWSAVVLSPQQNIAKLPFQVNGGAIYKGLIPTRDDDYTGFGVVYGKFSSDFARSVSNAGGGSPDYELVFEWNYKIQINNFVFVQPNIQWVINPGGTGNIPNALVLGVQAGVTF